MYDVIILGLGPAGSTLARLLHPGLRVACIDKKHTDGSGFTKPCGGLLAPDAQKELARFSLTLPREVLSSPQIFSVRTHDLPAGLTRSYQRFYLNVDRNRFDQWLISLIPPQVTLYMGSRCTAASRSGEGWEVRFVDAAGIAQTLHTRYLVGADGASSLLRRVLYPNKRIRRYTAIQQWFKDCHARPFYSCVFDERTTDCYSWSISKDSIFIFGGAYPVRESRRLFEEQKERLRGNGFLFGTPIKTEACVVLRPSSPADLCCGQDGAFLVGEAGGFISPSSLEGISSAIKTAALLADILNSGAAQPNRLYRRATLPLRAKLFVKLCKCPFMYHPLLRRLVMRSGLQTITPYPDIAHEE